MKNATPPINDSTRTGEKMDLIPFEITPPFPMARGSQRWQ